MPKYHRVPQSTTEYHGVPAGLGVTMADTFSLCSTDGYKFVVSVRVAGLSETLKNLMEDVSEREVTLECSGGALAKVLEYCEEYSCSGDEVSARWTREFGRMDRRCLFEIVNAANFLHIVPLLDLTCQVVADQVRRMTPEEIRAIFQIENDLTPEEEAEIRRENKWSFE